MKVTRIAIQSFEEGSRATTHTILSFGGLDADMVAAIVIGALQCRGWRYCEKCHTIFTLTHPCVKGADEEMSL